MPEPPPPLSDAELVTLLTAPAAAATDRDRAGEQLLELVRPLAARVAGRVPAPVGQWIQDEAVGLILDKLREFQVRPDCSLAGWVGTVLRNAAVSESRKAIHRRRAPDKVEELPAHEKLDPTEVERRLNELNQDLVRLATCPPTGGLNYAVLFAFQVMFRVRNMMVGDRGNIGVPIATRVTDWFPLSDDLWEGAFRPGDPPLRCVWNELTPTPDHPNRLTTDEVCAALDRLDVRPQVAPDLWGQWMRRARQFAHKHLGAERWAGHFAVLCGDIPGGSRP